MSEIKQKQEKNNELTPREIVVELDKYIVGQKKAKRAVAVALRNRMRRLKLDPELREDIAPKNILMIGPTGVGKTEIARRLAKLAGSPFIKVEATKYTEVGYVGRDVESMVRDLMAAGFQMVKQEMQETVTAEAEKRAEEALLDLLLPTNEKPHKEAKPKHGPVMRPMGTFTINPENSNSSIIATTLQLGFPIGKNNQQQAINDDANNLKIAEEEMKKANDPTPQEAKENEEKFKATKEKLRTMLREGKLDDRTVELMIAQSSPFPAFEMMGSSMEDLEASISGIAGMLGGNQKKKVFSVARAKEILKAEEAEKLVDRDKVSEEARARVEETGIIFIDEIDKIAVKGERGGGPDVSREGVQRDILPIVEGATVNTKWGPVNTDHILFIAAGAFNVSKPSDLIPELQGRFPLRVELDSLGKDDFLRILTEPKNALIKQYTELLGTENVKISFAPESIEHLAALAAEVNSKLENIGARRLHTIMEALLEELSFEASDIAPAEIDITVDYVNQKLADIVKDHDLGRYIL
ncbi:MAG: ATP-dependent protease ATPase subunit HslU [Treponema sp.]|jgi:ATP-dependent HslUV protease ATP-binding subunit HslU|nr:ATP-dependent protease ATPase subunit HslU [Treponema sp.]